MKRAKKIMKKIWLKYIGAIAGVLMIISGCRLNGTDDDPADSAKTLDSFSIVSPAATGIIDESAKTVAVTVPYGTNVNALTAAFTTTGASVKVGTTEQKSGVTANNFTNPVTYTVTAADGSTQDYTATVTVASSSSKEITSFGFASLSVTGRISESSHTIALTVPYGTNVTALAATFTTTGASVKVGTTKQKSGVTTNNFTNPVTYTVTAADGSTRNYTVTVKKAALAALSDWVQDAYIKASNTGTMDFFGCAVAADGDIMVIAAPYEGSSQPTVSNDDGTASSDDSANYAGAAYVFKRNSAGDWIQDAYLKASNAEADDYFGASVAVSGDIIVVGASAESSSQTTVTNDDGTASSDNSLSGSGAAYVFKKNSSGNWIQDAYLKASNAASSAEFGCSVAVYDETIVVGADNESGSGTVYVFKKDTSEDWIQDSRIAASNAGSSDKFGYSVAISGDIIVAGASCEGSNQTTVSNGDDVASADNSMTDSGAAYVFKRETSGRWVQDAYLKASNNLRTGYKFGSSVAISGNIVVVGSIGESSDQTAVTNDDGAASADYSIANAGAAYVFKKDSSGDWIQDAYLKASNTGNDDVCFGYSSAVSGDRIAIAAVYEDSSQTTVTNDDGIASSDASADYAGAVYVFKKDSSGDWIQDAYLKASNAEAYDCFGTSVAISADTIIAGASAEDSSQTTVDNDDGTAGADNLSSPAAGAAYVFRLK